MVPSLRIAKTRLFFINDNKSVMKFKQH